MTIDESTTIFKNITKNFHFFWCVAGGWAIDLYLNKVTRDHEDFEIILLRNDQLLFYPFFKNMNPKKIFTGKREPELIVWEGDSIEKDVIQLRLESVDTTEGKKEFDILLTPSMDQDWICRRDESIQIPLDEIRTYTSSSVPVLAPDIVLLFKAKYLRDKDRKDFQALLPMLNLSQKTRLVKNLEKIHPDHEWISEILL